MKPKVSVILTSYNHASYLAEAIDSVLAQTFRDFECFIVDDASTDQSWEVIQRYSDPRIIAIRREQNVRYNIYRVLPKCTGKYVAVHHSDDSWTVDKLEKQVAYLDAHPEIGACFTHVQLIDENSKEYEPPSGSFYRGVFDQPNRTRVEWLRHFFEKGNCLCHPSILIRRALYQQCGLPSYGMMQVPEFCMWIRLCLTQEIHVYQEKLTCFRLRTGEQTNASGDSHSSQIRSANEYFFLIKEFSRIADPDDFYAVFPDAAAFCSREAFWAPYALGRLLMTSSMRQRWLYGAELLFDLFQGSEDRKRLETDFHYTSIDFARAMAKQDVFFTLPPSRILHTSLFFDLGNGFNEVDCLAKEAYIGQDHGFYIRYDFGDLTTNQTIYAFRFDPDERPLWKIRIQSFTVDGQPYLPVSMNAWHHEDGYDFFATADPIYLLETVSETCSVIEIMGCAVPFAPDVFINKAAQVETKLRQELQSYQSSRLVRASRRIQLGSIRLRNRIKKIEK
jgi:glycosyltransferase involved in cell wall biosynthesis